ncbi:hypothetical protein A4F85_14515 [Delftia sp. GW456-R20]|nr:hypothetical protein A4F85_14515 [Delftia sp. GW456-R20]
MERAVFKAFELLLGDDDEEVPRLDVVARWIPEGACQFSFRIYGCNLLSSQLLLLDRQHSLRQVQ